MAPVKRSTTTAQRETRATRAATVAKKKVTTLEKSVEMPAVTKKTPASTKSTISTRKGKKSSEEHTEILDSDVPPKDSTNDDGVSKATRSGTTRTAKPGPTKSLAAAPRRRIKITPLDTPTVNDAKAKEASEDVTVKPKTTSSKRSSTRSKPGVDGDGSNIVEEAPVVESKTKATRKTTSKSNEDVKPQKASVSKARGRPKAQKVAAPQPSSVETEPSMTTRATRSLRSASIASLEVPATKIDEPAVKPATGSRKKVTFQDLPNENDKENQPLPQAKAKKSAAKTTTNATGLRAKPVRKPTTTATRGTRTATLPSVKEDTVRKGKQDRKMPQVLTPKKITQVAKSSSPERDELEASDGEDELNGGKTPVRDLSVSPRRPLTAAIARALSPAKKLDFGQSLVPKSPEKTSIFHDSEITQQGMLASPARRPAASPFKDALKDSPKRGLNEGARFVFPTHDEGSSSAVLNASTANSASQSMSNMMQSPKRAGVLDPNFFSQSAMKKSVSKSPFKTSLFGTPAKRLFSPAKKSSALSGHQTAEAQIDAQAEEQIDEMELESEVTASSHFRSSSSPMRIMRVEPDSAGVDLDDNVLQVRSPLKALKSPLKIPSTVDSNETQRTDIPSSDIGVDGEDHDKMTSEVVEPTNLDIDQDSVTKPDEELENLPEDMSTHMEVDTDTVNTVTKTDGEPAESTRAARPNLTQRQSLSQVLFRSTRATSDEESSEDELAGEQTPVRRLQDRVSSNGAQMRTRMSMGVPQSVSSKGFGFTPLAAQMSGWLASSPEKSPEQAQNAVARRESSKFSPMARQHIDGEVVISRDSTPAQKLTKRLSAHITPGSKTSSSSRKSMNLRKSLAQRQSLGMFSSVDSPAGNPQFEEYMEIRAMEEQADLVNSDEESGPQVSGADFDHVMDIDGDMLIMEDNDETILENEELSSDADIGAGDLTTDLINFTHASDTAMIDFKKLAEEANDLAPEDVNGNSTELAPTEAVNTGVEAKKSLDEDSLMDSDTEPANMAVSSPRGLPESGAHNFLNDDRVEEVVQEADSPLLQPVDGQLDSPSMLVIDQSDSLVASPSSPQYSSTTSPGQNVIAQTPQPNLRLHEQRIINTVVSKVPLKPEGSMSPIKMPKKRSRSFGNSDASPPKRISFGDLRSLPATNTVDIAESPDRRIRTSVAPSPGGTSTPATTKSNFTQANRYSLGSVTTPRQMSFAIDDFGDSTLDGIELPSDFDMTVMTEDDVTPARSTRSKAYSLGAATPRAVVNATPATAKRSVRQTTTSVTATKKTPTHASKNTKIERTPLAAVGKGVLHGAIVFVDVFTSEGADASGIFVDLLTQMGAKCVREWRWNSRASLAADVSGEIAEQKIGITHVVYKDGGKRTLQKVRDAKGEVCCVGVAWVLDCERENKWLDESSYTIDTSIAPRGGSNRRKSMEPRALLVANDGSVSASRPRRSVSAEMNELMKRELINTPARGQQPPSNDEDDDDENDENVEQATPTGFVSYDPRVAMTPGTPYLISQGKKLTQMSAPPKQHNKSLFADEDEENEDTFMEGEKGNNGAVKDAKKFRMKNLGDIAKRRRTLGFKPAVGSPLGRR